MSAERIGQQERVKSPQTVSNLPSLQEIIDRARALKKLGLSPSEVSIVAHPNGFHLNTDGTRRTVADENFPSITSDKR